ncbi:uncharacterized protein LOC135810212 isoform X2 [Sycon ciliatum]|uniref:uncharacterized protein LOC135810212 isoform X2 n=1 Tax=Sycon ciliatum TaxID=27933 RepID=UPI0031F719C2
MGATRVSLAPRLQVVVISLGYLSAAIQLVYAGTSQCNGGLCSIAEDHVVSKRTVGQYGPWTSWSLCYRGTQTRERLCQFGCTGPNQYDQDKRPCPSASTGSIVVTTWGKPTDSNSNTETESPATSSSHAPGTRPVTIIPAFTTRHVKTPPAKATTPRRTMTIHPITDSNESTTAAATTSASHKHTGPFATTAVNGQAPTTTPRRIHHITPAARATTDSTSRTDNYNLRITVAISSALVGSLLLVAVVACWRRLHLEQMEQRRQLMQPEATQPEYHGLPGTRQTSSFPAPPPTYHDAFQIDSQQIQAASPPPLSTSIRGANGTSGARDETTEDGRPRPPPSFATATLTPPRPVPPPPPPPPPPTSPSSVTGTGRAGGGGRNGSVGAPPGPSAAAREKSHVAYIVSHLKSAVTADELIEDEETCLDTEALLGRSGV